jgi:hypothetical protein
MSLPFNDTTNLKGLTQIYEQEVGYNQGDVSGNTTLLKQFCADVNLALDSFWTIAIPASGKWQIDDSNQTDYPIIKTNLVSGQRDYSFTTDGSSNLVLDIYKCFILPSATATTFIEVQPIDAQSENESLEMNSETTTGGIPTRYDKTGNGVLFSPTPNYSATSGLKLLINREASYFIYTDTTKKPGVIGIFHEYFALKPALKYAGRKSLANYKDLYMRVQQMEADIKYHYAGRDRGTRRNMSVNYQDNR